MDNGNVVDNPKFHRANPELIEVAIETLNHRPTSRWLQSIALYSQQNWKKRVIAPVED
jgi:hypothetical protein